MVFSTRALSKHSQPRPWPYPRHRFWKVMFQPPKPRFQDLGSGTSRLHTWRSPVFSSSRLLLVFSFSGRSATYLFSDILSFSCITTSTYFPPAQPSTLHSLGLEHVQMEATIQPGKRLGTRGTAHGFKHVLLSSWSRKPLAYGASPSRQHASQKGCRSPTVQELMIVVTGLHSAPKMQYARGCTTVCRRVSDVSACQTTSSPTILLSSYRVNVSSLKPTSCFSMVPLDLCRPKTLGQP